MTTIENGTEGIRLSGLSKRFDLGSRSEDVIDAAIDYLQVTSQAAA